MSKSVKLMLILVIMECIATILWINWPHNKNDIDIATFTKMVSVNQKEDKVGAKIWLKEAIHGIKGITYRYIIKTDCPKWDFESRYMSKTPLTWVDGKTSAVEVLIYSTQIRYNGTVYASGTYYIAPLLDGVASEDISLEDWKQNMIKQAYQTYAAEPKQTIFYHGLQIFIPFMAVVLGAFGCKKILEALDHKAAKKEEEV